MADKRHRTTPYALDVAAGLSAYAEQMPDGFLQKLFVDLLGIESSGTQSTFMRGEMIAKANPHLYIDIMIATGGAVMAADPLQIPPRRFVMPHTKRVHEETRAWTPGRALNYLHKWDVPDSPANQAVEFFRTYHPDADPAEMIGQLRSYFETKVESGEAANAESTPAAPSAPQTDGFGEIADLFSQKFLSYVLTRAQGASDDLTQEVRMDIQQGIIALQDRVAADFREQMHEFFTQLREECVTVLQRADPNSQAEPQDTKALIDELYGRLTELAKSPEPEAREQFVSAYSEELSKLLQLVDAFTRDRKKREDILQTIRNL